MAKDEDVTNNGVVERNATDGDVGPDINQFKTWIQKHYGENSRTKTITSDKYARICQLIRGEDLNTNAKFRFWVRSKGFRLINHDKDTNEVKDDPGGALVVSLHAKEDNTPAAGERSIESFLRINLPAISFFRKVATVEEFYGIIKGAHIDSKGVHAGQKKTYRLVSDTYAFLPREVITYYLLNCNTCKPRIQKYGPIHSKVKLNNLAMVKMNADARAAMQESKETRMYGTDASTPGILGKVIRPSPKRLVPGYMNESFGEGYVRSKGRQHKDVDDTSPTFEESKNPKQSVPNYLQHGIYTKSTEADHLQNNMSLMQRGSSYPSYTISQILSRQLERKPTANCFVNTNTDANQKEFDKMPVLKEERLTKGYEEYPTSIKHGSSNSEEKQLAYLKTSSPDAPPVCSSSCCSYFNPSMDSFGKMKDKSQIYSSRMQPYTTLLQRHAIRNYLGHTAAESNYKKNMSAASYSIPYFLENKDVYLDLYARSKRTDGINFRSAPSLWSKKYMTSPADSKLGSWKYLQERAMEKPQCI